MLYYSMYGHIETIAQSLRVQAKWMAQKLSLSMYRKPCRRNYLKKQAVKRKLHRFNPARTGRLRRHYFWYTYRFGDISGQIRTFLDQTGACGLPALYGKLASILVPPVLAAVRNELLLRPGRPLHITGMVIVPLAARRGNYLTFHGFAAVHHTGATTIAGGDGSRPAKPEELYSSLSRGIYHGLAVHLTANLQQEDAHTNSRSESSSRREWAVSAQCITGDGRHFQK